jgi:hypothetical protein
MQSYYSVSLVWHFKVSGQDAGVGSSAPLTQEIFSISSCYYLFNYMGVMELRRPFYQRILLKHETLL